MSKETAARPATTDRDRRTAAAGFLVFLFVLLAGREINRPFAGLHGWDETLPSWAARSHLAYGLGYTKGLTTLAVGNPPPAVKPSYLDQPQLHALLDAGAMALFGRNEAALRIAALIVTAASLPFLLALLRRLYGEEAAVLAAFLYIIFPITSYFNDAAWTYWLLPCWLLAYWCYLTLIGELPDGPAPGKRHLIGLASALFVMPQLSWIGFFYPGAIVSHYFLRCLAKRRRPDLSLLLTLVLSSGAGAAAVFGVLLGARTGGWRSMLGLYRFRAQMAQASSGRTPLGWFTTQWGMVQTNFTLPVVLIIGAYLGYQAVTRARALRADRPERTPRAFVHAWLFVMPAILNMCLFTESYWVHQLSYKSFELPAAIAAALGILALRDWLLPRGRAAANAAALALVAVICGFAARGLNDYYGFRLWSPAEIDMFKRLNGKMAPDETLLTYQNYYISDNPNKLTHIRPEVAWYLDREMRAATTLEEIRAAAAGGKRPFYLVGQEAAPPALIEQLKARYPWEVVPVRRGFGQTPLFDEGDQLIFDLRRERTMSGGEQVLMNKGLAAMYQANDPKEAAWYFRKVLALSPDHYGANYQLARTLDLLGSHEAEYYWKKTFELAGRYADAETAGIARKHLTNGL